MAPLDLDASLPEGRVDLTRLRAMQVPLGPPRTRKHVSCTLNSVPGVGFELASGPFCPVSLSPCYGL
jgi:hypothetical protein